MASSLNIQLVLIIVLTFLKNFSPSSSREEGLDDKYYEAELEGQRGNCDRYMDDCPVSLFDMITRLVEIKSN